MRHVASLPRLVFGLAPALLLAGCRDSAPPLETVPVRGTVVDQQGQAPRDGVVRLLTTTDPHLIAVGPIQEDGSFTVHSQRQGFEYPGAPPGEYEIVVITSKQGPDGNSVPVRFEMPKPYELTAPDNQLSLEMHR